MKLTEICVHKPVFSMVLSLIIVLAGVLCFFSLNMRYFPNVSTHTISITTNYSGAGAKLIADEINAKIEENLATISGIDSMISTAENGQGKVRITFVTDVDFSEKANEVRDKVFAIRPQLPKDADASLIETNSRYDYVMCLGFLDSKMTPLQIRDYLDRFVADRLQQVSGVGGISIWGAKKYAMRVWLDPEKMAAFGVTAGDIRQTLMANNVQLPLGKFESKTMTFPVSSDTALKQAEEFNNLIIKNVSGNIIRLKDVGSAELGMENDPYIGHIDGQEGVGIDIWLADGANAIKVAEKLRHELRLIQPTLPPDMKMLIPIDVSPFYKESVHEVYRSIILAIFCVLLVIYLFIGAFRSVIIPVVTIPICVIGVFSLIALCGFTINVLTLLAIVLSIGLVVDDAIVMLENIYRHIEAGMKPFQAALVGSREIAFSVIAMTLTLVAVYAPIGFLHTETSALFREFAFTLGGAVLISGFVALTLSPSLCGMLLQSKKQEKGYIIWLDRMYDRLRVRYKKILTGVLRHRMPILFIAFLIGLAGVFIFHFTPSRFLPDEKVDVIAASYQTNPGSSTAYTMAYLNQVDAILSKTSAIEHYVSFAMGNQVEFPAFLKKVDKGRKVDVIQVLNSVREKLGAIPGLTGFASTFQFFSGWGSHELEFYILTSSGYDELFKIVNQVVNHLGRYPGFAHIDHDMKYDSQEYTVSINRDLAESMYVSPSSINEILSSLLGSWHVTDFYMNNRSYQVLVQAKLRDITNPASLEHFYVKNLFGKMVPLTGMIKITPTVIQSNLSHYDRLPAAKIMIDLVPGADLSASVHYLQNILPRVLPENTSYAFIGKAKKLLETGSSMGWLFLLAIIFIYLILAAQFESFSDPLIILFTIPLSVVGALAVLKLFGGSINLYTEIGLVTLVGLITKHGILITKFANEILAEGKSVHEAVTLAASIRLRPILMTTSAMILGAVPLILATGSGSEGRFEIGSVIIGGLFFGTFFSLILVPVAYTFLKRASKKGSR